MTQSAGTANVPEAVRRREAALLATYATHSADTAGRQFVDEPSADRGPYEIDRDRIVGAAAYRRLSAKTQVFTGEMGDYHRTRLTHTLEVVSVARRLGRALALNEDLIETLAHAHDLGHPPFGHAGEAALDECLSEVGGFCHNRHALRIVETLESCSPRFEGLNLSREVLDGQRARIGDARSSQGVSLEAQVVEAADSVAYDTHDADDALKLGLVTLDELLELPLWRAAARRVERRYSALQPTELKRAILVELVDWQVDDLIAHTRDRLATGEPGRAWAIEQSAPLVTASDEVAEEKDDVERFLHLRVYRHPQVLVMRARAQASLHAMFESLRHRPELLPDSFRARIAGDGVSRAVGDYVAGMTDRYAGQQFARLADLAHPTGAAASALHTSWPPPRVRAG